MTERVKYHDVCKLFPAMSADEQDALVADIEANGLREPIVMYRGLLIDGRHRLAACQLAHVEPRFVEWDGVGSLVAFVTSKNRHRRHLTVSQLGAIAADIAAAREKEDAERVAAEKAESAPVRSESPESVPTPEMSIPPAGRNASRPGGKRNLVRHTAGAAKEMGVSERTAERARRIQETAPEVHEAVKAGSITLHAAEQQISPPKYNRADDSTLARAECRDACDIIKEHLPRIEGIDQDKAHERLRQLEWAIEGKRRAAKGPSLNENAEALYNAYPRRQGKGAALKAISKALATVAFDVLLEAVEAFAEAMRGEDTQFVPHPATWFNQRRWEDDRATWKRSARGKLDAFDSWRPDSDGPQVIEATATRRLAHE